MGIVNLSVEIPEPTEQMAAINSGFRVVSAITPEGIIRGIASTWSSYDSIATQVVLAVGIIHLDEVEEWTCCTYYHPFYLPRPKEPAPGIYLFPWNEDSLTRESYRGGPRWKDPGLRESLRDIDSVIFLHRPTGWGKGHYPIASNDPEWWNGDD